MDVFTGPLIVMVIAALGFALYFWLKGKKTQNELRQEKERIKKHLFFVEFPSQTYVFPYVPGTKREKVFWCEGEVPEVLICIEAQERITKIHQEHMEEMERLGV